MSRWRLLLVAAPSMIFAVYLLHVRHHGRLAGVGLLSGGRGRDKHPYKVSFGGLPCWSRG